MSALGLPWICLYIQRPLSFRLAVLLSPKKLILYYRVLPPSSVTRALICAGQCGKPFSFVKTKSPGKCILWCGWIFICVSVIVQPGFMHKTKQTALLVAEDSRLIILMVMVNDSMT